jgi:FkbM family methyltransferase
VSGDPTESKTSAAMKKTFDSGALGSDVARSRQQYWARRFAASMVRTFGLNTPGFVATEVVQAINPVASITTPHGVLYCKAGHGRLVWRAESFFKEEPDTVAWLDRLTPDDVYWDIGANVGLYAVYAAKFRRCQTMAFEPEAQNYALLLENIALNDLGGRCLPACIAMSRQFELGRLRVRYITKGGAFNAFRGGLAGGDQAEALPESFQAAQNYEQHAGFDQLMFGCSIDELVFKHGLPAPTHVKIDVDGLEPEIVNGAIETIKAGRPRSFLIELNTKSAADMAVPELLARHGFKQTAAQSNWDSREDKSQAAALPALNMVFERA